MKLIYLTVLCFPFLLSASALPKSYSRHDRRKQESQKQVLLANGTKLTEGRYSSDLTWQSATGILYKGCSGNVAIKDCYSLELSKNPKEHLDPHHLDQPRQRLEFSANTSDPGETHQYQWRYYLSSETGTTRTFFHLMQLLSRDGTGPVITLDADAGRIAIRDNKPERDCHKTNKCPSIPLSDFTNKTTIHSMNIAYGTASKPGKFDYTVTDAANKKKLIQYSVTGDLGGRATLKFGTYRGAVEGITIARASLGDFVVLK